MIVYIHTSDGETVDSGISLTQREGWVECDYSVPQYGADEQARCVGFAKNENGFYAKFEVTKLNNDSTKYSVRSIIRELKAINKFAAVRQMLEAANYDWDFIGSNYLSDDDEDFQTMLAAIVSQGILTQAELDTLLPKCLWSEG